MPGFPPVEAQSLECLNWMLLVPVKVGKATIVG